MTDLAPPSAPAPETTPRAPLYRDRCGLLRDYWYVACTSAELQPGQVLGRVVLEEALALFRGPDGAPHALRDRCLHRNAELSEGTLEGGCL
ncbi:MAG: Rieske (2Fe-2S) protein, partial [Planctomycetota bacterium]